MSLPIGAYDISVTATSSSGFLTVTEDGSLTISSATDWYGFAEHESQSATSSGTGEINSNGIFDIVEDARADTQVDLSTVREFDVSIDASADFIAAMPALYEFTLEESATAVMTVVSNPEITHEFDAQSAVAADTEVELSKRSTYSLEEHAEIVDLVELVPIRLFIEETAYGEIAGAHIKQAVFSVSQSAGSDTSAFIAEPYEGPFVVLPVSYLTTHQTITSSSGVNDLADLANQGDQTVKIDLYQGAWHQLVFPLVSAGEPVSYVTDAKLSLYRNSLEELSLTLNNGIFFSDSELTATFDDLNTIDLVQSYDFELWIVDGNNNPLFVNSGTITFTPTKVRF